MLADAACDCMHQYIDVPQVIDGIFIVILFSLTHYHLEMLH